MIVRVATTALKFSRKADFLGEKQEDSTSQFLRVNRLYPLPIYGLLKSNNLDIYFNSFIGWSADFIVRQVELDARRKHIG
jgi:hypothetical protein